MNYQSARLVFNQIALWAVLLLVVGLLTLLFSLLGTIFCAVVVGVMMGATRRWRWQAIAVSVVFPLVIITLSRVSKTELDWHHAIQMAVLCFAVFWATYAATYLLMFLERPSESPATTRSLQAASATEQTSQAKVVECSLADLRGTWVCETTTGDGEQHERVMTISKDEFSLSRRTSDGKCRLLTQGKVKWIGTKLPKVLVIYGSQDDSASKDG